MTIRLEMTPKTNNKEYKIIMNQMSALIWKLVFSVGSSDSELRKNRNTQGTASIAEKQSHKQKIFIINVLNDIFSNALFDVLLIPWTLSYQTHQNVI